MLNSKDEPLDIVVKGLNKTFDKIQVLRDIDLEVVHGERVAVIGPSGAGKTTLFRHLTGVLWPTEGTVQTLGYDTSNLSTRDLRHLRQQVGFLYQTDNLIPGLRVFHNVAMGRLGAWSTIRALLSLLFPREVERVRSALREVELEDKIWELPGSLSGGEQQRVAIARLLIQEPRIMLADEPVSSLDMRLGRDVIETLAQIAESRNATLVVSLHSLDLLSKHFNRIVALRDGSLVWQGHPSQLSQSILLDVYGAEYKALHLDELSLDGAGGE